MQVRGRASATWALLFLAGACGENNFADGPSDDGGSGGAAGKAIPEVQRVDQPCRRSADCADLLLCAPPGEPPPCGACRAASPCASDDDCHALGTPFSICGAGRCSCTNARSCMRGCANSSDCLAWQLCRYDHRCVNRPCDDQSPCPENFVCQGPLSDRYCARQWCTTDDDCRGYCVNGSCYPGLGRCAAPAE